MEFHFKFHYYSYLLCFYISIWYRHAMTSDIQNNKSHSKANTGNETLKLDLDSLWFVKALKKMMPTLQSKSDVTANQWTATVNSMPQSFDLIIDQIYPLKLF